MKVEKRHGGINALSIFETAVASLRDAFLEVFDENRLLRSHSSEADTLERRESRCGRGGDSPAEEGRAFETQSGRTGNGAVVGSGDDLLTSLYVASFSLHRTRDFELVMSSIKEILINLIGAERFQIFLGDRTQQCLVLVDDETNEGPSPRKIALTEGIVGVVAKTGIAYFETERRTGDFYDPLACVPLSVDGRVIGLILVTDLFVQKPCLAARDSELFSLLAEHAGPAILSALLWRRYRESTGFGLPEELLSEGKSEKSGDSHRTEMPGVPPTMENGEAAGERRLS